MAMRWKQRPPGSNWGEFGHDDQAGRLNLLTAEKIRQGIAEVIEARSFCLSLPLDYPGGNILNPRRFPPVLRPTLRGNIPNANYFLCDDGIDATDVINDDIAILHTHYSTHWDALGHIGQLFDADDDGKPEPVYYNGFRGGEDIVGTREKSGGGISGTIAPTSTFQAAKLGIENMAERCVQGRGVLIDLHAHFGDFHTIVGYDALMRVMEKDRVTVEAGDIVCFHTGFGELLLRAGKQPKANMMTDACSALDGRDAKLLNWISESNVVALIADNGAVEALPPATHFGCCSALPLHEHCLFKLGVHLGEFWYLTPLAAYLRARKRSRFLLTAPPLRLPGAIGSPATPVATV